MFISVLICTRNRAESLRLTLDSLFVPTNLQSPEWEAVVVDNDSVDHTAQVCSDFRERFVGHFRFVVEKARQEQRVKFSHRCGEGRHPGVYRR